MHYVMEACAQNNIPLIILDRPNPNGHYVDGPVLQPEFKSFVGMHPIPVVHGLTVGELALMINGEGWLENKTQCDLTIIEVKNWNHKMPYDLPIKPSPNLPNATAINLYPSLCFFEPTTVSIGRGTEFPFQVVGTTNKSDFTFTFTPRSIEGMAKHPKLEDKKCYGLDLRNSTKQEAINLNYLTETYKNSLEKDNFFTNENFFNLLAGNKILLEQIKTQIPPETIKNSWKSDLSAYFEKKEKYTIYN